MVAFNDLFDDDTQAHLLKYDSILVRLDLPVEVVEGGIKVGDKVVGPTPSVTRPPSRGVRSVTS